MQSLAGFIVYLLIHFCKYAPRPIAFMLGSLLGRLIHFGASLNKKRIAYNIDAIGLMDKNLKENERREILRKSCRHFGRFLSEGFRIERLDKNSVDKLVTIHGLENLDNAVAKKRGVILSWAHFGHFELGYVTLALKGYDIRAVIRTVDNKSIDRQLDQLRTASGITVIKRERAAREIVSALRQKAIVALMYDQNAAFNNAFVPFFGKPAATFVTPAVMARRTDCAVVPMFCVRNDDEDRYDLRIYPALRAADTADVDLFNMVILKQLNTILEGEIRKNPEQWLWLHRRWKTELDEKEMTQYEELVKKAEAIIGER
jgi:KDO2-lipid IV(A) lauroyltransferase